jgi:hypothetical protein
MARRRAAPVCRLRRRGGGACGLAVYDERRRAGAADGRGLREILLDVISGTTEPIRATQFDRHFHPVRLTCRRWESVRLAMHRGATLPPISVVQVATRTRSATATTASRSLRRSAPHDQRGRRGLTHLTRRPRKGEHLRVRRSCERCEHGRGPLLLDRSSLEANRLALVVGGAIRGSAKRAESGATCLARWR